MNGQHRNRQGAIINGVITMASVLVLSACGGGGGGGGGSSSSGNPVANPPPTATPNNSVARAGEERTVARNSEVSLDATGSSDPDGDSLTYRWVQTMGPDVTGGSGALDGATPTFTAPGQVSTLRFELRVSDGGSNASTDTVQVNVLENVEGAIFVDGDTGSDDSGDGSRDNPFASIFFAVQFINDNFTDEDYDVYVRRLASDTRYEESETTIAPGARTSLYGGYGDFWVRDVTLPTAVDGSNRAVRFGDVADQSWMSGFDLYAMDSGNAASPVTAIAAESGEGVLFIEDNIVVSGNVGEGNASAPASSYGLRVGELGAVRIRRNEITAGNGADGNNGVSGTLQRGIAGGDGARGNDGDDEKGLGGGGGSLSSRNSSAGTDNRGGKGGNAGTFFDEVGNKGSDGRSVRTSEDGGLGGGGGGTTSGGARVANLPFNSGFAGQGGEGGDGGVGGDGANGYGSLSSSGFFTPDRGTNGAFGQSGNGGGGGGGGQASPLGFDGGGGGGGGAGGGGGRGSSAAISGGASIGLALATSDAIVADNTITSASGGAGGSAVEGAFGGDGGNGAFGGNGDSENAGDGGWGAGGGGGGGGGFGGGGAGGPSFAIMLAANTMPEISNNTLVSGIGGSAGSGSRGGLGGARGRDGYQLDEEDDIGGKGSASGLRAASGAPSEGGYSFGIFDADLDDGASPTLDGNTITVGTPGEATEQVSEPGQSGEQNF